jgi:hypothetical protein
LVDITDERAGALARPRNPLDVLAFTDWIGAPACARISGGGVAMRVLCLAGVAAVVVLAWATPQSAHAQSAQAQSAQAQSAQAQSAQAQSAIAPQAMTVRADQDASAAIQPAAYYWHGRRYPYRWRGGYYAYRWHGRYYRHRQFRHGIWRYY